MKNQKQDSIIVDAAEKCTPGENIKFRQVQEKQEKAMEPKNSMPEQSTAGLNEKNDKSDMEDLYREKENRSNRLKQRPE